ncbi:MAG TPA: mycofactocin system GMC family oxidoreductase MftG [Mycobacterium sp.]|nr:mycofactocin system GMC family oxidoreductase MftG [Mycobacterium sp.]
MTARAAHSDVLIVGAGSAGSVIAEQLSADPNCTVTLLEAGIGLSDPALLAQVADGSQLPIGAGSPLVVRYQTELTERPPRQWTIVRGATLGGSGAVNGGYFCRGLPQDFDDLALPGWMWSDVVEHFRAVETDLDFHGPAHGAAGPIPVHRTGEIVGTTELFVTGAQKCGFSWIADLNSSDQERTIPAGLGAVPLNIVDGVRTGPGTAYLLPALDRPNLTVLTRTRAVRVDIAAGRAVGVQAVGPDGPVTVGADRIVLCAGAIESAHLLMLSGFGDEAMLRHVGAEVVTPLPVGVSCSDHPQWVLPVDWAVAAGRPALEVVLHTADGVEVRPYTRGFGAMAGEAPAGWPDRPHIGVALMQPRGRGRLTLVSSDPAVPLRIEHRYDSEPDDIAALHRGAALSREVAGAATEVGSPVWSTSQHLCGSVPMGTDRDERAVLDPQCRVRGIEGLWVVDGSVLPRITSRGPHATIVMIGHRAAEFIRAG